MEPPDSVIVPFFAVMLVVFTVGMLIAGVAERRR